MTIKIPAPTFLPTGPGITFERAEQLISMAEEREDDLDRKLLLGCATILTAIALEQFVNSQLQLVALRYHEQNATPSFNPAAELLNQSLWQRIRGAPEFSDVFPATLDTSIPESRTLRELIDLRNRLLHLTEKPFHIEIEVDLSTAEVLSIAPSEDTPETVQDPWPDVAPAQARRCLHAAKLYWEDVAMAGVPDHVFTLLTPK